MSFSWQPPDPPSYSYLLGLYLGDGWIVPKPRGGAQLGIVCSTDYPRLIDDCWAALILVSLNPHVSRYQPRGQRCVRRISTWKHWLDVIPQHGSGRKHDRKIELAGWQRDVVDRFPQEFLRGLLDSDGCRTVNRFTTALPSGRVAESAYPRWFFSNRSDDIRGPVLRVLRAARDPLDAVQPAQHLDQPPHQRRAARRVRAGEVMTRSAPSTCAVLGSAVAEMVPAELLEMQRLASVAQVGGFRPPSTPKSSWIASVLLGAPGESWPESNGRPMWPLCQILTEELPAAAPAPLADVALLTLFMDLIDQAFDQPHGQGWEVRTYATTDGLVPMTEPEREVSERRPEEDLQVRPFPVLWRPRVELPSRDDTPSELLDAWDEMAEQADAQLLDLDGLKVGGWPRAIQAEVDWAMTGKGRIDDAQFVLQVDSDEKAQIWIGDAGAAYIGRSPSQGWVLSSQCY